MTLDKEDSFQPGRIEPSIKNEVDQWADRKQSYQVPKAQEELDRVKEECVEYTQFRFNDSFKTTIGLNKSRYDKLKSTCPTRKQMEDYFIKKYKLKFNVQDEFIFEALNQEVKEETNEEDSN
jgi:hypothetical protein